MCPSTNPPMYLTHDIIFIPYNFGSIKINEEIKHCNCPCSHSPNCQESLQAVEGNKMWLCKGEDVNVPHFREFWFQKESNPPMGA